MSYLSALEFGSASAVTTKPFSLVRTCHEKCTTSNETSATTSKSSRSSHSFFPNEETKKNDLENLLQEPTTIHRTMRCHPVMFQNTKMPSIFSCEVYLLPPHNEVIRDQLRPKSSAFIASYIACCFFFFRDSNHVVNLLSNRSRYIQKYILYSYHIYHYMNVHICYVYI